MYYSFGLGAPLTGIGRSLQDPNRKAVLGKIRFEDMSRYKCVAQDAATIIGHKALMVYEQKRIHNNKKI